MRWTKSFDHDVSVYWVFVAGAFGVLSFVPCGYSELYGWYFVGQDYTTPVRDWQYTALWHSLASILIGIGLYAAYAVRRTRRHQGVLSEPVSARKVEARPGFTLAGLVGATALLAACGGLLRWASVERMPILLGIAAAALAGNWASKWTAHMVLAHRGRPAHFTPPGRVDRASASRGAAEGNSSVRQGGEGGPDNHVDPD